MAYITSWERIAREEGLEQGREQGLEQGIEKGKQSLLKQLITQKFGNIPDWVTTKIEKAKEESLEAWALALFQKDSLEDLFGRKQT